MKRAALSILVGSLACFCAAAQEDAGALLKKSIEKVRGSESYKVTYRAVMKAPQSDPMVVEGTSVWSAPGVLYVHYRASGGDEKRIVRVGEKVWIYHELLEDWVTDREMGDPGAGRGVQSPEDVLGVILKHAKTVSAAGQEEVGGRKCGVFEANLSGPEIEVIVKEQAMQGDFVWKESTASGRFWVDPADGLIYKFTSAADLKSKDPNISRVSYTAEVNVVSYGGERTLSFSVRDPQTGKEHPLPIPQAARDEIAKLKPSEK